MVTRALPAPHGKRQNVCAADMRAAAVGTHAHSKVHGVSPRWHCAPHIDSSKLAQSARTAHGMAHNSMATLSSRRQIVILRTADDSCPDASVGRSVGSDQRSATFFRSTDCRSTAGRLAALPRHHAPVLLMQLHPLLWISYACCALRVALYA